MSEDLAATIGLPEMLAPLPGEPPVGEDLRQDFAPQSLYYRLRDARAEARALERAADSDASNEAIATLEWRTVRQLASQALTQKTKDLEIAAWLTEALVRGEGLSGLAIGAGLMAELVKSFWAAGLYPAEDEDGIVTRVAPITGLNGEGGDGTLIQPLRKFALFNRPDGTPIAFFQYEAAVKTEGEADQNKKKQRLATGVLPFADVERDASAAGGAWFAGLRTRLKAAIAAWNSLSDAMDAAAGRDSPPTGRVREILEQILEACTRYAPPESLNAPEAEEEAVGDGTAEAGVAPGAKPKPTVENREDMLRQLVRISEFFKRTEPHSPLAYTLEDAVRRGRMTWPELLAEIVPDEGQRRTMLVQLGIRPQQ